ncbi:MAG: site-2 protease family protein [Candidatus Gastranaerophilales bacterium]|nr:site-2 protease family protein [Candidatus Gastranaerophilales bacterium]
MFFHLIELSKNPIMFLGFIVFLVMPLLFSISFHELAHGYIAYKFGDITPKMQGRLTLNPLAHLDPAGTIMLFLIGLGWAKPVIINLQNIPDRTQQMLVALAGPASNFLLAVVFALFVSITPQNHEFIITLFDMVVKINLGLMLFNLLPIPPLDGSRIVSWLLPPELERQYNSIEPYGIFILLIIIFTVGFGFIFQISSKIKMFLYGLMQIQGLS